MQKKTVDETLVQPNALWVSKRVCHLWYTITTTGGTKKWGLWTVGSVLTLGTLVETVWSTLYFARSLGTIETWNHHRFILETSIESNKNSNCKWSFLFQHLALCFQTAKTFSPPSPKVHQVSPFHFHCSHCPRGSLPMQQPHCLKPPMGRPHCLTSPPVDWHKTQLEQDPLDLQQRHHHLLVFFLLEQRWKTISWCIKQNILKFNHLIIYTSEYTFWFRSLSCFTLVYLPPFAGCKIPCTQTSLDTCL